MGILSKTGDDKKNASIMVRMPSNLALVIDTTVGISYTSRPDFVIDGIRRFVHYINNEEAAIMTYLQEKEDAARDVKLEFYYASIKERTDTYRKAVASAAEKSKKKDVDILLSLPKGLASQIDRAVERTKCFRNHQEFIKSGTVYLTTLIGMDNTNDMLTASFLESNQSTKDLREQIDKMKKEMEDRRKGQDPMNEPSPEPDDEQEDD